MNIQKIALKKGKEVAGHNVSQAPPIPNLLSGDVIVTIPATILYEPKKHLGKLSEWSYTSAINCQVGIRSVEGRASQGTCSGSVKQAKG